jgi:hypothetical protein
VKIEQAQTQSNLEMLEQQQVDLAAQNDTESLNEALSIQQKIDQT